MTDTLFDIVTRLSKTNNKNMRFYKHTLKNLTDMDIRKQYKESGEKMFEPFENLMNEYKNNLIPNNLKSIAILREINNPDQIEKLNECEKLETESLEIIDEILDILKNIIKKRLNTAIIGTLEGLARQKIKENNIEPTNVVEQRILDQPYSKGGLRKRKNKTNNKKYTKNRTYERSEKYISKKNNTRKTKKNYL